MKKEYLILIVLILLFSAYLFLHKENKNTYTLPEIKTIDTAQVTGLILEKKDRTVQFTQKEKQWVLTDKEYPADPALVETMLNTLKTLKLSALVSEKQDLKRYELDDENRVLVKAMKNDETVFEFSLGKTAPTRNHTFVMIKEDKNIYHAGGDLKSHFDRTAEDFRDKKVLEFKDGSLKKVTLEKDGKSKTLISKEGKKDKEKTETVWSSEDGVSVDHKAVTELLSTLAFLKCQKYPDSPARTDLEKDKPLCKIILENEANLELILFKGDTEEKINGISSMNNYVFELSRFNGEQIISDVEKLLGIQKDEKKKE
ncbi:MAG: hypothetical protein A2277_01945 [Desulfobacterales bacterium RIFOXYA12_FULL_46_15]|nr:MAG: hypothetical protein A2277_01945 [Desulfobacterales bacterium RIFOXYA12_FULL_46_15]